MFEPLVFTDIARQLSHSAEMDAEGRARAAWGRVYYSLYLAVRKAIREAEGRPAHGRGDHVDHGALRNVLYSAGAEELVALAKLLESLYDVRRRADYELEFEERWRKELKPGRAERKARSVAAFIRSELPKIDFSPILGIL